MIVFVRGAVLKHMLYFAGVLVCRRREHIPSTAPDGTPTFTCPLCPNKSYKYRQGLYRHTRIAHTDNALIKCDVCQKSFTSGGSLRAHKESVHLGIKYECPICKVEFTLKGSRRKHMRTMHGVVNSPSVWMCTSCEDYIAFMCWNLSFSFLFSHNETTSEMHCASVLLHWMAVLLCKVVLPLTCLVNPTPSHRSTADTFRVSYPELRSEVLNVVQNLVQLSFSYVP